VRTERARHDSSRRKRLEDLDDADPIFLTRRHTAYNRGAFYHHWKRLFAARPRQKEGKQVLQPLEFSPHDIRHLHVTESLTKIKQKCIGNAERERILRRGLQRRMAWRSPLTIQCYDHSFTEQEDLEAYDAFQCEVEQEQTESRVLAKKSTKTRSTEVSSESSQSKAMRQAAADLEFWKDDP
jgi:integrase